MLPDLRIRQRDYLLEIARALTEELNLDKLLTRILTIAVEMLSGQAGLIVLRGETHGWNVVVSHGIPEELLRHIDPLLRDIPDSEDPTRFELQEISRKLQALGRVSSLDLLTGVGLPLISRHKVIGLIFVFRGYRGVFSNNDRALLQSFADQAAIAVQNAQYYSLITKEKNRLDALLESAADGILILSPGHNIERCNQAFLRLYGEEKDSVIGKLIEDILNLTNLKQGISLLEAEAGGWPLTPNATLYIEGDLERPNSHPVPVGITFAPSLDANGVLVNIIGSIRDISHFREAEELKSTFISVVSHELKTPVALIKGYVGTLRREDVSWDREIVEDSLAVIEEEADRLTDLIENLLDASRLQAGGLSLNRSDISPKNFLDRVAGKFATQTNIHEIQVDVPKDLPVIVADESRLEQVMSNLISNAIKYSEDGGEIRISGRTLGKYLVICVQDQGPGIQQIDIPHIFDRFYRADDASKKTKGAGLGLYLTRAIIEAHGGRIWVDPKPGDGARICFSIPKES